MNNETDRADYPGTLCACIVLAAGASERLGQPKQQLRLDGETLLHRTARLAIASGCCPVLIVLGSSADVLKNEVENLPVKLVRNEKWISGMASSLRAGLQQLQLEKHFDSPVLILVCDQVGLSEEHIRKLLYASGSQPGRIVASHYNAKLGVPAIFPLAFHRELANIQGDRGAREILRRYESQIVSVPFPEGASDIDTLQDAIAAGLLMVNEPAK